MRNLLLLLAVAAAVTVAAPTFSASAETIALTPKNTKISWSGSTDRQTNHGGFGKFEGALEFDPSRPSTAKITVEIETESITSNAPRLTNHLKTPDFFHVNKYPKAKFVSSTVKPAEGEKSTHEVTGNLTLLGNTEKITFPVTLKISDPQVTLESKFVLDRSEFGMKYGVGKIKKEVEVTVQVRAQRK